jgi:hypothetical protein
VTGPGVATSVSAVRATGHPIWHFAAVAAAAVGAFGYLKVKEWLADRAQASRGPRARPTLPVILLAAASAVCAVIHAAACPEHLRESVAFGFFFLGASAAQMGWAALVLVRPSRQLLTIAAIGNLAIVTLWVLSRTAGLPVGPDVWRPEAVGAVDAIATQLEMALAAGAWWLLKTHSNLATRRPSRPAATAAA